MTISITNIASKPLGLLRQMLFATFYGVTAVMSACRFAQTITFAFMNFFTTDTLNAGFLPLYERYKHDSSELARCFFWWLFALVTVLSCIIFVLLYVGANWIVSLFAPGFEGGVVDQSVHFIRAFAFSVPFCLLGTLLSYLAMTESAYIGVGSRAMFESAGLIVGVLLSVWTHQVFLIAWSFVVAYVIFFTMMMAVCYRKGLLQRVSRVIWRQHSAKLMREFWQIVRPLLVLPFFMQGKFIVEKMVASLIAVSVVAALDYARFIIETGINVIAGPIGLVGLAAFSRLDRKQMVEKLEPIILMLFMVSVPITAFLVINSEMIIRVLYGYGAFNAQAVKEASAVLVGMSVAFFAQVIAYVLIKVLSAQLQNRRVVGYMVLAISANMLFIVTFHGVFGPLTLGLGESLYASILFILCSHYFKLFGLFRRLAVFLLPATMFYSVVAINLQPHLIPQGCWFAVFWSIVLLLSRETRNLLMQKVFAR